MDITVEHKRNGMELSAIVGDQLYRRLYMDYSKREAKQDFRRYVREEEAKIIRCSDTP